MRGIKACHSICMAIQQHCPIIFQKVTLSVSVRRNLSLKCWCPRMPASLAYILNYEAKARYLCNYLFSFTQRPAVRHFFRKHIIQISRLLSKALLIFSCLKCLLIACNRFIGKGSFGLNHLAGAFFQCNLQDRCEVKKQTNK